LIALSTLSDISNSALADIFPAVSLIVLANFDASSNSFDSIYSFIISDSIFNDFLYCNIASLISLLFLIALSNIRISFSSFGATIFCANS